MAMLLLLPVLGHNSENTLGVSQRKATMELGGRVCLLQNSTRGVRFDSLKRKKDVSFHFKTQSYRPLTHPQKTTEEVLKRIVRPVVTAFDRWK